MARSLRASSSWCSCFSDGIRTVGRDSSGGSRTVTRFSLRLSRGLSSESATSAAPPQKELHSV
eukprot:7948571-Pyramimonas_sp.AAC.1